MVVVVGTELLESAGLSHSFGARFQVSTRWNPSHNAELKVGDFCPRVCACVDIHTIILTGVLVHLSTFQTEG